MISFTLAQQAKLAAAAGGTLGGGPSPSTVSGASSGTTGGNSIGAGGPAATESSGNRLPGNTSSGTGFGGGMMGARNLFMRSAPRGMPGNNPLKQMAQNAPPAAMANDHNMQMAATTALANNNTAAKPGMGGGSFPGMINTGAAPLQAMAQPGFTRVAADAWEQYRQISGCGQQQDVAAVNPAVKFAATSVLARFMGKFAASGMMPGPQTAPLVPPQSLMTPPQVAQSEGGGAPGGAPPGAPGAPPAPAGAQPGAPAVDPTTGQPLQQGAAPPPDPTGQVGAPPPSPLTVLPPNPPVAPDATALQPQMAAQPGMDPHTAGTADDLLANVHGPATFDTTDMMSKFDNVVTAADKMGWLQEVPMTTAQKRHEAKLQQQARLQMMINEHGSVDRIPEHAWNQNFELKPEEYTKQAWQDNKGSVGFDHDPRQYDRGPAAWESSGKYLRHGQPVHDFTLEHLHHKAGSIGKIAFELEHRETEGPKKRPASFGEKLLLPAKQRGGDPDKKTHTDLVNRVDAGSGHALDSTKIISGPVTSRDLYQRIWNNPRTGPIGKGLGMALQWPMLHAENMPKDSPFYHPASDTVVNPWNSPATLNHELGHAIDYNGQSPVSKNWLMRQIKGTGRDLYGIGTALVPGGTLWKEHAAWRKGTNAFMEGSAEQDKPFKGDVDNHLKSMHSVKAPALGSYYGHAVGSAVGTAAGLPMAAVGAPSAMILLRNLLGQIGARTGANIGKSRAKSHPVNVRDRYSDRYEEMRGGDTEPAGKIEPAAASARKAASDFGTDSKPGNRLAKLIMRRHPPEKVKRHLANHKARRATAA